MKKGIFIVLSGPSGVGKDTIAQKLIQKIKGEYSVSMTSRKPRPGEIEGKDYFFVTKEKFEENIKKGNLLEYAIYNNNYYGTPKKFILNKLEKGIDIISVLDIQGGINIEKIYPEALLIFLLPPSFEELENRLRNRNTDTEEDIERRLAIAKKEIAFSSNYDYEVINDTVDRVIEEITVIVDKEKKKLNSHIAS